MIAFSRDTLCLVTIVLNEQMTSMQMSLNLHVLKNEDLENEDKISRRKLTVI